VHKGGLEDLKFNKKGLENIDTNEILNLHFSHMQMFNERTINKRDSRGKKIKLVSLWFPYSSQYQGCYISVNSAFIRPYTEKSMQVSVIKNAKFSIYRYDKATLKNEIVTTLTGEEIVREFNYSGY